MPADIAKSIQSLRSSRRTSVFTTGGTSSKSCSARIASRSTAFTSCGDIFAKRSHFARSASNFACPSGGSTAPAPNFIEPRNRRERRSGASANVTAPRYRTMPSLRATISIVGPATTPERRNGGAGTISGFCRRAATGFPATHSLNETDRPGSARTFRSTSVSASLHTSSAAAPAESAS